MPAVLRELGQAGLLGAWASTITGLTLGELLGTAAPAAGEGLTSGTVRSVSPPLGPTGSIRVVRGSLAPDGAVIKVAAASAALLQHTGPALVFDSSRRPRRA